MNPQNIQDPAISHGTNSQCISQLDQIINSFWFAVDQRGTEHSSPDLLSEQIDLYRDLADHLVASQPSDQELIDIDQFDATQIIKRLRRGFNDENCEIARDIAWRIICVHEQRGVRPRHIPYFHSQKRALLQDLGNTEELRELLLRSIGRNMSEAELLSCRRFARQSGRVNRAHMFDQLIYERRQGDFGGFTPEIVREMRDAISISGADINFGPYGSPNFEQTKPAPAPLFTGLLPVSGSPNLRLRLLHSSNEIDYASNKLRNCLAATYKGRIKSGYCWVVTLEQDGKPEEAIEINQRSMRITQWAGVRNSPPNPARQEQVKVALRKVKVVC